MMQTIGPRYGVKLGDLEGIFEEAGLPKYRLRQLFDGLYERRIPLEECSDLPAALRDELAVALPLTLEAVAVAQDERDATTKWLWRTLRESREATPGASSSGSLIETVLMCSPRRATVCVSSQAGCAMACTFCATGQAGFDRHLDAAEIVEQVIRAAHSVTQRVSNIVFMGMGEPLANFEAVWEAVERFHGEMGISARNITISTVGVVPGMEALAKAPLPVTLAVSLHAPDDALRSSLVPLNNRYPIAAVLGAARSCAEARGRRVTIEYALIRGVNDRPDQARALAELLHKYHLAGHVNLIPLNPTSGFDLPAPRVNATNAFAETLDVHGVHATVRRNRGRSISAACGQLKAAAS